jgi:hypothetical protein
MVFFYQRVHEAGSYHSKYGGTMVRVKVPWYMSHTMVRSSTVVHNYHVVLVTVHI